MKSAIFIKEITVVDPDSGLEVEIAIYKDIGSGGIFGVDSSYVAQLEDGENVFSPFDGESIQIP